MIRTVSLAVAIAGAALVACAPDGNQNALTNEEPATDSSQINNGGGKGANNQTPTNPLPGTTPTNKDGDAPDIVVPKDITAREYFDQNVHSALQACAGCHSEGGAGPTWIAGADKEKSYALLFQRGYVARSSALLNKGVHSAGAAAALAKDSRVKLQTWIELELKERGDKAPPSVLQKLGGCLDKAKFDAIKFETLVTVTRNANNNPGKQTENADECTGCAARQCSTCHSSDPATGFLMAVGNDILPADQTFNDTKATTPPYLQKYFGLDTNGDPIASKALKAKADATLKAEAYTHPMYALTPAMEAAIDAFVADAVQKYKTNSCAK